MKNNSTVFILDEVIDLNLLDDDDINYLLSIYDYEIDDLENNNA